MVLRFLVCILAGVLAPGVDDCVGGGTGAR